MKQRLRCSKGIGSLEKKKKKKQTVGIEPVPGKSILNCFQIVGKLLAKAL